MDSVLSIPFLKEAFFKRKELFCFKLCMFMYRFIHMSAGAYCGQRRPVGTGNCEAPAWGLDKHGTSGRAVSALNC